MAKAVKSVATIPTTARKTRAKVKVVEPVKPAPLVPGGWYDLGDLPQDLPEWILPGLFRKKSVNIIYGKSNAGKSIVSVDLISRLAYGLDYVDQKLEPMLCMAVIAEDGDSFGARRLAWLKQAGLPSVYADQIKYIPYDGLIYDSNYHEYRQGKALNAFDSEQMEALGDTFTSIAHSMGLKPGILLFDNMNNIVKTYWRKVNLVLENARKLARKQDCAVVFLGNPLKAGPVAPNDYNEPKMTERGPGTMRDDVDGMLVVYRSGPAETTVRVEKQRNGQTNLKMNFGVHQVFLPNMQKDNKIDSAPCAMFKGLVNPKDAIADNPLLYAICDKAGNDSLVSLREMAMRLDPKLLPTHVGSQHTNPIKMALARSNDPEGWISVRLNETQTREVRYVDNGKKKGTGLEFRPIKQDIVKGGEGEGVEDEDEE